MSSDKSSTAPSSVSPDVPLHSEEEDRLDRRPFAQAVARLIATRTDPSSVVIAIYAPWGDGKTTVLNWIERRLAHAESNVVVVRFNPWLVTTGVGLLPAFLASLSQALGRRLGGRKKQIAQLLQRYGRVVAGLSVGVPPISFDPGETIAKLGEAMGGRTIDELRSEFEAILRESDQRLLVIIDDVDRLDDDETAAIFKLVKLVADFEGVTYLMAFDDSKVAAALAKRYSNSQASTDTLGAVRGDGGGFDFLEKIVQLPLRLPRARKRALDELTLEGLQAAIASAGITLSDQQVREFRRRYDEGLSPAIKSVRVAKRYASAASFALPLLKGETNASDVLTVEGISVCYPAVYGAMREHPAWFLLPYEFHLGDDKEIIERATKRIEAVLNLVDSDLRESVKELIGLLFPQTGQVRSGSAPTRQREEWAVEQRVSSAEYFDRYFAYGVGDREIADQEVHALVEDPTELASRIEGLVERKGDQALWQFIDKADRLLDELGDEHLTALAWAMSSLGSRVVRDNEPRFFVRNLMEETASFVARVLLAMDDASARLEIAKAIVQTAEPLLFALECYRWMNIKKSGDESVRALDETQSREIGTLLGGRIAGWVSRLDDPIWTTPHGLRLMYEAERDGQAAAIKAHVSQWLAKDPSSVVSLLTAAAGRLYGGEGVIQDDLTTDKFEALGRVADMTNLEAAVASLRGDQPVPEQFPALRYASAAKQPTDRLVLDQFAWQDAKAQTAVTETIKEAVNKGN